MRKLLVLGLAAVLVFAFTLPAAALENEFGGYWRTRFYANVNFAGEDNAALGLDSEDLDWYVVDTRTRLYYTAILNENLKFVNKFEWDTSWGTAPLGDFGADGKEVEIKNSYADFNLGPLNAKVGIQGAAIGRSLVFDNDFSGLQLTYKHSDVFWLRGSWLKQFEGEIGKDRNDFDVDAYALEAGIQLGDMGSIKPYVVYKYSDDYSEFSGVALDDEASLYWLGADVDLTLGSVGLWGSLGYVGGSIDQKTGGQDSDVSGYVAAIGASMPLGPVGLHGQAFYASGDDDPTDPDQDQWVSLGMSYYWAEILGYGIFDFNAPAGTPADQLANIYALNIGGSIKPVEKLTLRGDIWYASLIEDETATGATAANNYDGETDLGTEIDVVATYQLVEGLNLDLVGAYLFAGDAISTTGNNDDDPYEVGARLSLSF